MKQIEKTLKVLTIQMKKYAEAGIINKTIRKRLTCELSKLNKVSVTSNVSLTDSFVYVPCTQDRYLLYVTKYNRFIYWYFYSLVSSDNDFCIETDEIHNPELLESIMICTIFTGTIKVFDIIVSKGKILKVDYSLRYNLVLDLIDTDTVLNQDYTLEPSVFLTANTDLNIFTRNFEFTVQYFLKVYTHQTFSIPEIMDYIPITQTKMCRIHKTEKSEIYNVFDSHTDEKLGILYIKTLLSSIHVNSLFENTDTIINECSFNQKFKKWQISV